MLFRGGGRGQAWQNAQNAAPGGRCQAWQNALNAAGCFAYEWKEEGDGHGTPGTFLPEAPSSPFCAFCHAWHHAAGLLTSEPMWNNP